MPTLREIVEQASFSDVYIIIPWFSAIVTREAMFMTSCLLPGEGVLSLSEYKKEFAYQGTISYFLEVEHC